MKTILISRIGLALLNAPDANAETVDMEGIAPPGQIFTVDNNTSTFGNFDVAIVHGHYMSASNSQVGVNWVANGTDWLQHDALSSLVLSNKTGDSFSIQSVDIAESVLTPNGGTTLNVVGTFAAGGSIMQAFITDDVTDAFETFFFSGQWTGLSQVSFTCDTTVCAYDNLVLNGAPDTDADGVVDAEDNCIETANVDQRDSNADGYGNICDADLDDDGVVNFSDLALMKMVFFTTDPDADLDGDGGVNFNDLALVKIAFFGPPGPSGIAP